MFRYRNESTGREYERPVPDEWLEASAGWSRVDEPEAESHEQDEQEGSDD